MAKLWAGRAEKETAQIADDFNSSLHFDCRMYRQDITGSMASPCSLYSENLVTFGESDYDQSQATGFINLWGLTTKMQALKDQGKL